MARAKKQVSIKGLADFMTASQVRARRLVRDYKYPEDDEARAQILYYREARDRIVAFHQSTHSSSWLEQQAQMLDGLAAMNSGNRRARARLEANAVALRSYQAHFSMRPFKVLSALELEILIDDVRVTVRPDMHVEERRQELLIKLEFGVDPVGEDEAQIIAKGMSMASARAGLSIRGPACQVFDVRRGLVLKGPARGTKIEREIEAACQSWSAIWNQL